MTDEQIPPKDKQSFIDSLHDTRLEIDQAKETLDGVVKRLEALHKDHGNEIKDMAREMKDAYYHLKKIPDRIEDTVDALLPKVGTYFLEKETEALKEFNGLCSGLEERLRKLHDDFKNYDIWKYRVGGKMLLYAIIAGGISGSCFCILCWRYAIKYFMS